MSVQQKYLDNGPNQNRKSGLAPDQPIMSVEFDYLGRGEFASRLAKQLLEYGDDQCLVVAFYAPWGAGKSSLLNLLTNELVRQLDGSARSPIIIKFNPWNFSGLPSLISMFFRELEAVIGGSEPKAAKNIRKSLQALSFVIAAGELSPVGGASFAAGSRFLKRGSDMLQKNSESLDSIKKRINEVLRQIDRRIFILIDDVDRLDQESMRYMFRLIRLNADFDSVTYVMAFDRNVVESVLKMEQGVSGHEYLEKIVQVGFDIPPAEPCILQQIFSQRTKSLGFFVPSNTEEALRWAKLEGVGFYKLIRTPRDVVRYANGLVLNGAMVKDEVNPVDFAVLEAIRTFAPELYAFIRENRDIVISQADGAPDIGSGIPRDVSQVRMEEVLSLCNPELKDALREVCKQLFPEIDAIYAHPLSERRYSGGRNYFEMRRAKRVCTVEFFPRYFYLRPFEWEVSQVQFEGLVSSESDHGTRVSQLGELIDSGKIDNFLRRLGDFHADMPEEYIQLIVLALFDLGDRLETGLQREHPLETISGLVHWLLERQEEPTRINILRKVANETISLGTMACFAQDWDRPSVPEFKLIDEKRWDEIRRDLVARIRAAAEDMTLANSPHLGILLYWWKEWGVLKEVRYFVGRLVESDDGVLVFLQGMMVQKSTSIGEYAALQGWYIPLENIREFVDLDILNESVQRIRAERRDDISVLEQAAVEAYLEGMTSESLGYVD